MGELWKLCKLDIYKVTDRRSRGLAARLVERWPTQITSGKDFNNVMGHLNAYDPESGMNPMSNILQDLIKTG